MPFTAALKLDAAPVEVGVAPLEHPTSARATAAMRLTAARPVLLIFIERFPF
jgi:hypothetical protein